jgi:TonB family protein
VRLLARRIGFSASRRDILGVPGEVLRIDWVLRSSAATMDAITVVGRREPSDSRLAGFRARAEAKSAGHFVTRERIEQSGSRNVLDALRGIPGVRMGALARGPGRTVRLRGARCPPLVFLDGFPAAATEFELESIDLNMVEGLEVYPSSSSLPPEFFSARGLEQCGVIAIWSRPAQARRPRAQAVVQRGDSVAAERVRARAHTADQVDQMAELTGGTPAIVYPDSLHRANVRGEATLEFVVGADGKVDWRTLRVVSATHPLFAEALRQALSAARWLPARAGGSPVAQLVVLPAVFDVEDRPPGPAVTGAPR